MPRKQASKKRRPLSEKQVAKDEELRKKLRNFDLKKFDRALAKALRPKKRAT